MIRRGLRAMVCLVWMARALVVPAQEKEVALTIYNDNLALVKDVRTVSLERGVTEVAFQDVAAQIDPTSVYFKSLTAPDEVAILEQNYEYDLVNASKLLQKYIDREITLQGKGEVEYSGTLLNASGGEVILREPDGGIKMVKMETVETLDFPSLPEGLITRPTLVWQLDSDRSGDHRVEVGYLTSGIQWHAEYVGITEEESGVLQLGGWVSIDNKSGATYTRARLKLVAGDVHRAQRRYRPMLARTQAAEAAEARQQFEEKAFFEYHLYTLQRPTTVANNQIKQISLFPPAEVQVSREYTYDGAARERQVQVHLVFQNEKEAGLGMPLPEGKIRVYQRDADESLVFIGEDFVRHTPKDEEVRVYVGNAFDLVGERTKLDHRRIAGNSWEETWEIKLRNHKDEAVEITVIEHLQVGWEILENSHEFTRKDANTIEFPVNVPAGDETTLRYVVRYTR